MQVQISGQQLAVTEALRAHVLGKIDRLNRTYKKTTNLAVVLSVSKREQRADATLAVAGTTLRAEAVESNLYGSIDRLFDRLVGQLRKYHGKVYDKHAMEVRKERVSS